MYTRLPPVEHAAAQAPRRTSPAHPAQAPFAARVLALQRTAGNRAVGEWLDVQRVVKRSITQPAQADRDATVPDLTAGLVQAIAAATTPSKRQTVLDDLKAHLWQRFGLDAPSPASDPPEVVALKDELRKVRIRYSTAGGRGKLALTQVQYADPGEPVLITVYAAAFAQGAPQLYSTLRHELIHAAQRALTPDEVATAATDEYMFETEGRTKPERQEVQLRLQEIEAYAWELQHANETGISTAYLNTTSSLLVSYAEKLAGTIRAAVPKTTAKRPKPAPPTVQKARGLSFWDGYLDNAAQHLGGAANAIRAAHGADAVRIDQAATALTAARKALAAAMTPAPTPAPASASATSGRKRKRGATP